MVADASVEGRGLVRGTFSELYQGVVSYGFFDELEAARDYGLQLLANRDQEDRG